jgi:hypothetical protein
MWRGARALLFSELVPGLSIVAAPLAAVISRGATTLPRKGGVVLYCS